MKLKFFLIIFLEITLFVNLCAQTNQGSINVYISQKNYDSVKAELDLFIGEINKVKSLYFNIKNIEQYKNDGILLENIGNTQNKSLKKFDFSNQESFHLKFTENNVKITASFALGFKRALIYYLDKMGFYYYAPMPEWNIRPKMVTFFGYEDEFVSPSFYARDFFIGYGVGPNSKATEAFSNWKLMNNFGGSIITETMHIYNEIIYRNNNEFLKNDDFINGNPNENKNFVSATFNLLNKEVIALVLKDSRERIKEKIAKYGKCDMISMEPSDGNGFDKASEKTKAKIGNASNQAFWLANKVAAFNQAEYPNVLYGMSAYNNHVLPPSFPLNKNLYVEVANGFNFTGYRTAEILQMYKPKVNHLGLYEYLDVYDWSHDLPGLSVSASSFKIEKNLKMAYANGARYFNGESSSGWINRLIGHYVLGKKLWNINANIEDIKEKLFTNCFGNVKSLVAPIFETWEKNNANVLNELELLNWYGTLKKAQLLADNVAIKNRIEDVINYVNYLLLYTEFRKSKSLQGMKNIIAYARNNNDRPVFASFQCLVQLPSLLGYPNLGFWQTPGNKDSVEKASFEPPIFKEKSAPIINNQNFEMVLDSNKDYCFDNDISFTLLKEGKGKSYFYIEPYKFGDGAIITKMPTVVTIFENNVKVLSKKIPFSNRGLIDSFEIKPVGKKLTIVINDLGRPYSIRGGQNVIVSISLNSTNYIRSNSTKGLCTFYVDIPKSVASFYVVKDTELRMLSSDNDSLDLTKNNHETIIISNKIKKRWRIYNQNGFLKIY